MGRTFRVWAPKEVIHDLCLGFEQEIQLGRIPDFPHDLSLAKPFPLLLNFRENIGRFQAVGAYLYGNCFTHGHVPVFAKELGELGTREEEWSHIVRMKLADTKCRAFADSADYRR